MKIYLAYFMCLLAGSALAQTNPLWTEKKAKNFLPHMTSPEVAAFLKRSDIALIPIGALEQHGDHLPIGTDYINGIERCKLIARERDVLVAPVLLAGQSPYHMGFPGTITLSAETIVKVHMEAVASLVRHGFKRFIITNSHGGNKAISAYIVDQINQTLPAVAVNLEDAIKPFQRTAAPSVSKKLDRHAGTPETSNALYLMPDLVELKQGSAPPLTLPDHLERILSEMLKGDQTATMLFLAEGLKMEETGKKTSAAEMSATGVWGERDPKESTAARGEAHTKDFVNASIAFIDRWNELLGRR